MALIAILVLQRLTLPLGRIDIEVTALSVSYSGQHEEREVKHDQTKADAI
jgi:hypothetical protein